MTQQYLSPCSVHGCHAVNIKHIFTQHIVLNKMFKQIDTELDNTQTNAVPSAHVFPLNPSAHVQSILPSIASTQVPPFVHGSLVAHVAETSH